jgi:hypothetical protein
MPVERDLSPDLKSDQICAFLSDYATQHYSDFTQITADRTAAGFDFQNALTRELGSTRMALRTFAVRSVDLFTSAGRFIRRHEIIDPIDHGLVLKIVALLFTRAGISQASADAILDAFQNADLDNDAIDQIETRLIRGGVGLADYYVDLSFTLDRTQPPEQLDGNYGLFMQQMGEAEDAAGRPAYRVVAIEGYRQRCDVPNMSFPDKDIVVVADALDPLNEISGLENESHPECEGLEITPHRIGTAFQYYEWKIEWEVRPIRIGRCQIMKTKIPIIYSRIRKEALWCYAMTTPQLKRNIEKAIVGCLEAAAVETAVLAIVTGGLGLAAAAQAFANAFWSCLEKKVEDAVTCIFTSLKLVSEPGEWREKVF